MNQLARGMVIVVRLDPVEGSETGKERPCIIVTNDFYNHRVPVIQVVPVTSWNERKEAIITNVVIDPDGSNGLSKRSGGRLPADKTHRLAQTHGACAGEHRAIDNAPHRYRTPNSLRTGSFIPAVRKHPSQIDRSVPERSVDALVHQ
jgi:mRNA interferase MazF